MVPAAGLGWAFGGPVTACSLASLPLSWVHLPGLPALPHSRGLQVSGCAHCPGPAPLWPGVELATAHGLHGLPEGPLRQWKHATASGFKLICFLSQSRS